VNAQPGETGWRELVSDDAGVVAVVVVVVDGGC